ncbi:MAG: aminotransferase class V-fold PLP-dependent enzyme [Candidatus Bathyarchaeota archaeon]|nr:aminotransferase class V-fold PLP-dependent enzyme [Candidatus Bathyarchaeota archaeon]
MDKDEYLSFDHGFTYLTGISDLHPRTLRYMMRPHLMTSPDFFKYYNETIDMIKKYMHTKSDLVPVVGPGRSPMATSLCSFCEPEDKVLFIDNGYWGRYPAEIMAPHYKIKPVLLSLDVHRPMDLDSVEKTLKEENDIKAIHAVHVETEIGAINPIKQIGELIQRHAPDALFIVDSASAFPGNPLDVDKWGIDVDYFVSHKGFNGPSGLNFLSVNEKAWDVLNNRKTLTTDWYSSVKTWKDVWLDVPDGSRHCLESFPIPIVHAMRAKLDLMDIMGEETYLKKYEIASRTIREGLRKMTEPEDILSVRGPKCEGCPGCDAPDPNLCESVEKGRFCSQTMFTMIYPEGFPWQKFMDILENRYWMAIPHFGFGDDRKGGYFYSENGMRIGCIREDQHYPRNIIAMLTAVGLGMQECGVKGIKWNKGVEKAVEVLKEFEDIDYKMYKWAH